jgi:hypothetical protein
MLLSTFSGRRMYHHHLSPALARAMLAEPLAQLAVACIYGTMSCLACWLWGWHGSSTACSVLLDAAPMTRSTPQAAANCNSAFRSQAQCGVPAWIVCGGAG